MLHFFFISGLGLNLEPRKIAAYYGNGLLHLCPSHNCLIVILESFVFFITHLLNGDLSILDHHESPFFPHLKLIYYTLV